MPIANTIEQHSVPLGEFGGREITMTFKRIPACPEGFLMGSRGFHFDEEPTHRVVISNDFWLGKTLVTQAQFTIWTKANGIDHRNHFGGNPDRPAESMTWQQACSYCEWLTDQFSNCLPTEHPVATLPTESHWEYACRGNTTTQYYIGDGEAALREAGWFGGNSENATHPVGKKTPNQFNLYDMHGNVWEWCLDRWDISGYRRRWDGITADEAFLLNEQYGDQDKKQRPKGEARVLRGGSWDNSTDWCRSAYRNRDWAGNTFRYDGFRVCLLRNPPCLTSSAGEL